VKLINNKEFFLQIFKYFLFCSCGIYC